MQWPRMTVRVLAAVMADRRWLDDDRRRHKVTKTDLAAIAGACVVCAEGPCWMAPEGCITPARHAALFGYDPTETPATVL